jgi:hypothetical protein
MSPNSIREELMRAAQELDLETRQKADAALTDEQRNISVLAAKLIDLSRDMRRPGATLSEAGRIERLIRTIKGE